MSGDDSLYGAKILGSIGSQGISDDDIVSAVGEVAFSDAASATPEMLYGRSAWEQRLADDPDGLAATAEYEYDWNFAMTPGQRAEAVWRNSLADAGYDLLRMSDERTHEETKAADAVHLEAVRRRRMGGV